MKLIVMQFMVTLLAVLLWPVLAWTQTEDLNPVDFGPKELLRIETQTGTHEFMVEIADSEEERTHGYMFKESLSDQDGLLFQFPASDVRSIWMKDTPLPLDILFVRADGRILKIVHSHTPFSLRSVSSGAPVPAVLEIKGGLAETLSIRPNDRLVHSFFMKKEQEGQQEAPKP